MTVGRYELGAAVQADFDAADACGSPLLLGATRLFTLCCMSDGTWRGHGLVNNEGSHETNVSGVSEWHGKLHVTYTTANLEPSGSKWAPCLPVSAVPLK